MEDIAATPPSGMTYAQAAALAARSAEADSESYRQGLPVSPKGTRIGD